MKTKLTYALITTLLFLTAAATAGAQPIGARVQGKITSGTQPVPDAQVVLTSRENGRSFKLKADKNGQVNAIAIPYGTYDEEIFDATGKSLFKRPVAIAAEQNNTPDDISADITEGKGASKEEIEKAKAERDKALNANTLIQQLNPALKAKDWATAEPILQKLITVDPNRWEYYQALGNAQLNQGKNEEAVATFEKGIPLATDATKNDPKADPVKVKTGLSQMLTNEGNAYLKLKQNDKGIEAFNKAAALDPNPGTAFFNLCAVQYNSGNTQGALAACDKAIAADPARADAYFIKGSLMVGESKLDKDGKLEAPAGTSESLNKYLELAPDGPHAGDVKQMLQAIGAKIETTYKEKKKK